MSRTALITGGAVASVAQPRGSSRIEEIARGVLFLIADGAGFITGTTLSINGGKYLE